MAPLSRAKGSSSVLRASPKWQTKKNSSVLKAAGPRNALEKRKDNHPVSEQCGAHSLHGPALICEDVKDWLRSDCQHYPAMYVPRAPTWGDIQCQIDALAESGAFGRDLSVQREIKIEGWGCGKGSEHRLAAHLMQKAQHLVATATRAGLSTEIGRAIQKDFKQVGMVMAKMAISSRLNTTMKIKLDILGENGCGRWHQDQYTARAVVTYNGPCTVFVAHEHVDFWELKNCGDNSCVLRDPSQVQSADVGDILLMKGTKFPSVMNGLVHKSPEKTYHENGYVKNRLLLKVDLL